jgi:tRNA pseudouridine55 synthase
VTTSGILNVNKEPGMTSFQAVGLVRRGSGERRVGHAGTLDPLATGVLLVLLGQAVRVTEYLMDLRKTYRATVRFGAETTTYDAEGEVTIERPVDVTRQEVDEALRAFAGEIQQAPPVYSALKVRGQPAYRRARRGETVEMKPRPAHVYRIDLARFEPPDAEIEIECGRGTYIRSIAHDLGAALGCGAHLAALERTAVGPFRVEEAVSVPSLRDALESGEWRDLLQPIDCALLHLPALTVLIEDEKDLRHGQPADLGATPVLTGPPEDRVEVRGYAEDGSLIGILRYDAEAQVWRPRKVFG